MREIKFRVWHKKNKVHYSVISLNFESEWCRFYDHVAGESQADILEDLVLEQFTGLLDKNGLTELYEGDIIDISGTLKGNVHENIKGTTDLAIQGFGSKAWIATYAEAMERGCKDSE